MIPLAADFFSRPVGVSCSWLITWGWFTCISYTFGGRLYSSMFFALCLPGALVRLVRYLWKLGDDEGWFTFEVTSADGSPLLFDGERVGRLLLSTWAWATSFIGVADAFQHQLRAAGFRFP